MNLFRQVSNKVSYSKYVATHSDICGIFIRWGIENSKGIVEHEGTLKYDVFGDGSVKIPIPPSITLDFLSDRGIHVFTSMCIDSKTHYYFCRLAGKVWDSRIEKNAKRFFTCPLKFEGRDQARAMGIEFGLDVLVEQNRMNRYPLEVLADHK